MTREEIESAIVAYYEQHGRAPSTYSGDASEFFNEDVTWRAIHDRLRHGYQGGLGGTTLAEVKRQMRGVQLPKDAKILRKEPFAEEQIVEAARKFREEHGRRPMAHKDDDASKYMGQPSTWSAIDTALNYGLRGLPGGETLSQLLTRNGFQVIRTTFNQNMPLRIAKTVQDLKPEIIAMIAPQRRQILMWAMTESQVEIAKRLHIRQPSICHHIYSMIRRTQGFNDLTPPSAKEVREAIKHLSSNQQTVVMAMYKHGHQSKAAEQVGRSQGFVRHHFYNALRLVEDTKVGEWLVRHTVVEPQWSVVELSWFKFLPERLPRPSDLHRKAKTVLKGHEDVEPLAPEQAWEFVA